MLIQLLQQRGFNPPPPNAAQQAGFQAGFMLGYACSIFLVVAITYGPLIFVLAKAAQAQKAVGRGNRTMGAGSVWLGLIPVFNLVWAFFVVAKTTQALTDESADRRMRDGGHGQFLGYSHAALLALALVANVVARSVAEVAIDPAAPNVGLAFALLGVSGMSMIVMAVQAVLGIIYAVKLGQSTARLTWDDDDDYDDRPRKKRRKPARDEDEGPRSDDDFEEFDDKDNDRPRRLR